MVALQYGAHFAGAVTLRAHLRFINSSGDKLVLGVLAAFWWVMIFKVMGQPRSQVQFVDGHGLEKALGGKFVVKGRDGGELWSSEDLDDSVQSVKLDVKYWPVRKRFHIADFNQLENSGLYWHIVDVIWIFLFPLFYLIT